MIPLRVHPPWGEPLATAVLATLLALAAAPAGAGTAPPPAVAPFLVADLDRRPGAGSDPQVLETLHGRLLFRADDGVHDRQLWATDGTPEGTVRLSDEEPDPYYSHFLFRIAGGRAFFSLRYDLWVTDGTPAGTRRLLAPIGLDALAGFGVLGDRLYFGSGTRLWTSDGTVAGTVPVGAGSVSHSGDPIYPDPPAFGPAVGGRLYFRGADDHSLWTTDGTAEGTLQVADVAWPEAMVAAGDLAYFRAGTGASALWVSDGTPEGTRELTAPGEDWTIAGAVGERLLYASHRAAGWELRASRGEAGDGALLAVALDPPGNWLAPLDGLVLFALDDAAHGRELWRTNGTPVGTALVRDIFPGPLGSNPGGGSAIGGRVIFVAGDAVTGAEPWVSDGSAAGTHRLADVAPGPHGSMAADGGGAFARLGDAVLFAADDGTLGRELWGISLVGETGTCAPDGETLCFYDGRFAVRVEWTDPRSGNSGVGHALPGSGRTGAFWFFRADNTELVVKLLDARRVNGYFWFFYGALTDVEYDLTVLDTLAGRTRTYHNPPGWSCGGNDNAAFPGAP